MSKGHVRTRSVTLHDVATDVRLAPMAVSRALNGSGYVSPEARERVLAAARRLNYRPNVLARSLRRQATKAVGILLPDMANPFSSELVQGIESVLLEQGYDCLVTASLRNIAREKSALAAFIDHRVDGILVATRETRVGNEALTEAVERGTPVVTVGRDFFHPRVDHVTADHWRGAFDAAAHLVGLGHNKIGFLGASIVNTFSLRRFAGFVDALREHGLEPSRNGSWVLRQRAPPTPLRKTATRG